MGSAVEAVLTEYSSEPGVDYVDFDALPDDRDGFKVEVTRGSIHAEVRGLARPVFEWWATATSNNVGGVAQDWMDYRYGEGWDDDEYDRLMARDLGYFLYGITNLTLRLDPHPKRRKKALLLWLTRSGQWQEIVPFTHDSTPGGWADDKPLP